MQMSHLSLPFPKVQYLNGKTDYYQLRQVCKVEICDKKDFKSANRMNIDAYERTDTIGV